MKVKRLSIMVALALLCLPTAGCWDATDINDRDILTAIILDKTDNGYAIYAEVPQVTGGEPQGGSSKGRKPSIVRAEGRTLEEVRTNLDHKMDKPVFLGAVQTVVFTERMASYDIEEYALRLRQAPDYRKTVQFVVTTDDPAKLLDETPEHSQTAGFAIYDTIKSLIHEGQLYQMTLMQILERLSGPYKHNEIPTVALVDGEFTFTGMTLFSGGMKHGFIPAVDVKPMVFLRARKPKFVYVVPFKDDSATVEVSLAKKKIKPRYDGDKPDIDMSLDFRATLQYTEKGQPVTDEDMAVLQATLQAMLNQDFMSLFMKSQQEYHHDVLNLFESFQNAYPNEFERMNWAEEYEKASLNLSVTVNLGHNRLIDYDPMK